MSKQFVAMKNWLDQREWIFTWASRASSIILLFVMPLAMRWGRLEIERYGRDNFANVGDMAEVRNQVGQLRAEITEIKTFMRDAYTKAEHAKDASSAAQQISELRRELSTINTKLDAQAESLREVKTDVRELRKHSAIITAPNVSGRIAHSGGNHEKTVTR